MDIVTLGAALNGAKKQTENYVGSHFKGGSNIQITNNPDGTQTISASGEVSAEDTVARETISDHISDKANPHEVTAAQVGLGNVNNTSDIDKPVSTAMQTALDAKANTADIYSKNEVDTALSSKQNTIPDLADIRSGAALGSTAVQPVSGKGLSTNDFTDAEKAKLDNHVADNNNPHQVTKEQVGLGNVDNVATKDALAELVDSGAKNRMDLSQPETVRDTAYSSLADGGVNLSCSNKVWTQYTVVVPVISGKDFTFAMKIANVNGDLSSGYIFVRDENNNNYFDIRITAAGEYVKTFTATTNTVRVLVFLNNSSTAKTVSLDAYGMLCTAEDYAISPEFVPYAPTNRELYEKIEADVVSHELFVPSGSILDYVNGLEAGFYTARQGYATGTDKPMSNGGFAYLIFVLSAKTAQITAFESVLQDAPATPDIFTALKANGVWGPWYKQAGTPVAPSTQSTAALMSAKSTIEPDVMPEEEATQS